MSQPVEPPGPPYVIEVEPGRYAWCRCGRSSRQPYCDGSHQGTGLAPLVVTIEETRTIAWCGCKRTATPPLCDGTHSRLP
jgi:CDGSH-type Zn-finger protein